MDRSDYNGKMKELLKDNNTYRPLKMDPTNKQKSKLITILRRIKAESRLEYTIYKRMSPLEPFHPNYMGFQKLTRGTTPWGPLCQAKALWHMGWQKSWPEFWNHWLGTPITMSTTPVNMQMTSRRSSWKRENASFHMMFLPYSYPFQYNLLIQVIKTKLEQDTKLQKRTMSTSNILELLEFHLCNT